MDKVFSWRLGVFLVVTLLRLFPGDSQRVEMPKKDIEAIKGQMVVLEAWYTPTSVIEKNTVIWNFKAREYKNIITYSSGEIGIGSSEFRKRVGFAVSMPSTNLSIYINNTQESDSGNYLCNVIIPGAPTLSGELNLDVKVPPTPPVCSITGDPVLRGNVTLSCKSSYGKPVPQYKWTKAAPVSEIYFPPMQNERQGTLKLTNLTKSMSGKYVCKASNTAGSDSCHINLEVSTPSNIWFIAGATVGSGFGIMALVLFLVLIFRRECDIEEEMANEIKEDAQAPKRVSWSKSATPSDIISKNGTLSSIANSPAPQDPPHIHTNHYPYSRGGCNSIPTAPAGIQLYPGEPNPLHGLPGYNVSKMPTLAQHHQQPKNSSTLRTDGAQPQAPCPTPVLITSGPLCGAVPVMVPAQKQAGSLV
ncbi:endothelial cell-selective adhesion molecule-like isoform X2 [Clarias gariepinus]|uniref:endothelial cell-selective adhesion molecule-like isoform X2 n=1 Tax=Clarias gariepinus TaxID=13013 RepID=UPI00234C2544|nr:endothelial cell-selective adhesion molecule-like isoform X2 [Clarias gariepinus]